MSDASDEDLLAAVRATAPNFQPGPYQPVIQGVPRHGQPGLRLLQPQLRQPHQLQRPQGPGVAGQRPGLGAGYRPQILGVGGLRPQAPGAGAQQPPVPGVGAQQPPVPGVGAQQPPVPGAGAQQPPVHGAGAQQPPVHGAGAQQPPVHGAGVQQPPVPGVGVQQPLGAGAQQPPAYGAGAQQPPVHGVGAQQPPAYGVGAQQQQPPGAGVQQQQPHQAQAPGVGGQQPQVHGVGGQQLQGFGGGGQAAAAHGFQQQLHNDYLHYDLGQPQLEYPPQVFDQGFIPYQNQGLFAQLYGQQGATQFIPPGFYSPQDQTLNKSDINSLIKKEGEKLSLLVDAKLDQVKKSDVNFKSAENKERYNKWASVESKVKLLEIAINSGADKSFISSLFADLKAYTHLNQSDELLEDFAAVNGQKKIKKFKEFKKLQDLGFFNSHADLKLFKEICKDVDKPESIFGEKLVQQHELQQYAGCPVIAFPSNQGGAFSNEQQFANFLNLGQSTGQVRPRQPAITGRPQTGRFMGVRKYPPNPATDVPGGHLYCDVCKSSQSDHTTWLCPNFRRNDHAINSNNGAQQAAVFNRQPLISTQLAIPNAQNGAPQQTGP